MASALGVCQVAFRAGEGSLHLLYGMRRLEGWVLSPSSSDKKQLCKLCLGPGRDLSGKGLKEGYRANANCNKTGVLLG